MVCVISQAVRKQMTDVRKQMTDDGKQKSDWVLHLPVFTICRLTSDP
jgi:hypothetical protein